MGKKLGGEEHWIEEARRGSKDCYGANECVIDSEKPYASRDTAVLGSAGQQEKHPTIVLYGGNHPDQGPRSMYPDSYHCFLKPRPAR